MVHSRTTHTRWDQKRVEWEDFVCRTVGKVTPEVGEHTKGTTKR